MKGFYRGLGVVKGEGVASAKKALPFPLKKRNIFNILNFINFIVKTDFSSNEIENGAPRLRGFSAFPKPANATPKGWFL